MLEDEKAIEYLQKHVKVVFGEVPFIHAFGDKIGHCEVDSPGFKSIKSDYYVMCSSNYITQIFRYIKHFVPVIRLSTTLMSQLNKDNPLEAASRQLLSGKYSFLVPD